MQFMLLLRFVFTIKKNQSILKKILIRYYSSCAMKFRNGDVSPSAELSQHTAVCVFRAVENRLAVVRSVNTGISCLIDTAGRIKDGFEGGTLPQKAMSRTAVGGWFADRVPIDKRTTFFSIYGQWPDICCAGCFVGLLLIQLFERSGRNKRYGKA